MENDICSLLFKQIDKPKNFELCKAINVYDDKYRINIYVKEYDTDLNIEKKRIKYSYFAKINKNALQIIA
jgi:hypothetical protein